MNLSDAIIGDLARPLARIIMRYYENPDNEKKFQEWLKQQEIRKKEEDK